MLLVLLALARFEPAAAGLSDNFRIASEQLGYELQYRVYTPAGVLAGEQYPVLFVTDGQWYIDQGGMVEMLDALIERGAVKPLFAVFVDSRDPDDLRENRRNQEFMCKPEYANFYTAELLPALYLRYPISAERADTGILGVSFGGLNSACFGIMASNRFSAIGMHSPASARHIRLVSGLYQKKETELLRVFMSAGTVNDNLRAARRFRDVLMGQGHAVTWVENTGKAHNWENWTELMDDALLSLFPAETP